ncbi:LacI family transcriptional regulator [Novosphingobium sp. PhB165]|uniref:LacI family DNA-binding transcriptional regulator n=1 Tax=Novosphingobium sp. PhB165 TaxID=2485105 RepID=UPI00105174DF|nr:LacI family DNA-binding transcriptional regulator [Novosphingobium sp. PhB165]TCM21708.1 LacI family transcriptional regulator [Novosphingobium sp. PhB165]
MIEGDASGESRRTARRGGASVTVSQVAHAAGVSPMTVSRVVNGDPRVSQATREKVDEVIRDLGYVPNPAARSLASGRQCRIGLLYSNPSASYLSEFLVGALAEAARHDAQIILEQCEAEADAAALVGQLRRHRLDAVLLPPPLCDDPQLVEALVGVGMAVAQVATGRPAEGAHTVCMDDEGAAAAMTARLIALGHRRIGFIGGDPRQASSQLRLTGYRRALAEAGIAMEAALETAGDYSYRSGLASCEALLDLAVPPTAIFAANDDMAAAAVAVTHRRGLDVPRDVSICGFDDTAIATTIWPELTTVRQPVAEMARMATQLLAGAIAGGAEERQAASDESVAFSLIARDSDGPPQRA